MSDSTHSEKLTLPEQLRAWSGNSFGPYRSPLPEMLAAADEIERLQHDLSRSVEATTQYLNEVERLREMLRVARCPNKDATGHEQLWPCQWCDEQRGLFPSAQGAKA